DLWRWDGFVARAGAPTAAATRLEQRNRLDALAKEIKAAKSTVSRLAKLAATAQSELDTAQASRSAHLRQIRELDAERATIAAEQSKAANARAAYEARTATLADRAERLAAERADAETAFDASVHALQSLPNDGALTADISDAERALSDARAGSRNARSKLSEIEREAALTAERQTARSNDARAAQLRGQAAAEQKALLGQRLKAVSEQLGEAESAPAQLEAKRAAIAEALDVASAKRRDAADALAEADQRLAEARRKLKDAQHAVLAEREKRARVETRLEAARAQLMKTAGDISEALDCDPPGALKAAGISEPGALPDLDAARTKLSKLKSDRDRLGGVNLQAADELDALQAEYEARDGERGDVEAAIAKLRSSIGTLNREARKRLVDAFESVNTQFANLFETLFGGGEARLEMIDADDVLEGGLEIVAKPPGKQPVTLSLLSGGEQTLTALSLIFAVFLTNPSPICVLDEVDAPLDDANVDRFCTLMDNMCERTETRFLVITHHPMTMSRMHRLYGVTMAERGISQLVSVDLTVAERFLEAS
ncbi:MAG: chromosome segregation protein SMC, partial [Pseudomonadota bacterium]